MRSTSRECDIRLTMPARAENVVLARHVTAALAEAIGMTRSQVEDIRLAVTEACTNVVRHAYDGTVGPMELQVTPIGSELTIVVRDHGCGIDTQPASAGPGLGMPLIAALADSVEFEREPDNGSRVCMCFRAGEGTLQAA
jgi:serine/threonine-protein kinase RsbW